MTKRKRKGGPSAISRLDRDVISLPGIAAVIWMEGINDFGAADAARGDGGGRLFQGRRAAARAHPGVTIVAATLISALHSIIVTHSRVEVDAKRKALDEFLRTSKIFDGCKMSERLLNFFCKFYDLQSEYSAS